MLTHARTVFIHLLPVAIIIYHSMQSRKCLRSIAFFFSKKKLKTITTPAPARTDDGANRFDDGFDEQDLLDVRHAVVVRKPIDDPQQHVRRKIERRHREADVQQQRMHVLPQLTERERERERREREREEKNTQSTSGFRNKTASRHRTIKRSGKRRQ